MVDPQFEESFIDPLAYSSSLEHVLEHVFLAEVLQEAWFKRRQVVDVLHTSVDAFGYDVVLEVNGVMRQIQLKGRSRSGKTASYKITRRLAERSSGCVVVMLWERNPSTDRIELEYRWFGGAPGEKLPDLGNRIAKHTKGDATGVKKQRADVRVVPLSRFDPPCDVGHLLEKLFGPA